ncbi:hypothetical protein AMK26_10525 [Streptomyces sp. CB03234]|uniref:hypothetical protein n=1 Tax=Streptomyces sp. (strain CB03234) TaxID=1703937 RepID=UPI000939AF79|nr:hypothetical protein [Streptomyces sp. CB03234]OKK06443.1 hypothetical protein AMK26_10525 [Streptomyces sp. CB03234]
MNTPQADRRAYLLGALRESGMRIEDAHQLMDDYDATERAEALRQVPRRVDATEPLTAYGRLLAALVVSPEVRPGQAPALIADRDADVLAQAAARLRGFIDHGFTDPATLLDAVRAYSSDLTGKDTRSAGESTPVVVRRVDCVLEPARGDGESETTVGCIAEDGRPVALLLDDATRAKLADWLRLAGHDLRAERLDILRRAVKSWQGEWTPVRARRLYQAHGIDVGANVARRDLRLLGRQGLLVVNDRDPHHRAYRLNTWKDSRR